MPQIYRSAEQFESLFTELFARVENAGKGGFDDLVKRKMLVRFRISEPDVAMAVDGRKAPAAILFGPSDGKATLSVELTADSLHELLVGTLPLGKALSGKRLRLNGSKLKALSLKNLFTTLRAAYIDLAAERLDDA